MTDKEADILQLMFEDDGRAKPVPIANQLQGVAKLIQRSALRAYPDRAGVSFVQAAVIVEIGNFGPISARDLSTLLTMHEGQLSRTIKTLVGKGWVDRVTDPDDARRKLLMLTREGKTLQRKVLAVQKERENQFLQGLSLAQKRSFFATLNRIMANAKSELEQTDADRKRKKS